MGLKEQLLKAKRKVDEVETPELEVPKLRVRELSGADRDLLTNLYLAQGVDAKQLPELYKERGIVRGVVNDAGDLVFEDEDAIAISKDWGSELRDRVWAKIEEISGMKDAAVEDETKNLLSGQSSDSGTGLPLHLDDQSA